MGLAKAAHIIVIMLAPTVAVAAAIHLPRAARAMWRVVSKTDDHVEPQGQPLEQLAADLRRLLRAHDELRHSPEAAMRVRRLRALEAAISDCAVETARATGVPLPGRPPPHSGLPGPQLRPLLRALAEAGVVLPAEVDLIANDRRR